jgi:hypothetical protein
MACINGYEVPPVCFNGSGAGYAIDKLVVDVADRQVVNDGTNSLGFSKPVTVGEEERSEAKTDTIVGNLATSTCEYVSASALKELFKVKVLSALYMPSGATRIFGPALRNTLPDKAKGVEGGHLDSLIGFSAIRELHGLLKGGHIDALIGFSAIREWLGRLPAPHNALLLLQDSLPRRPRYAGSPSPPTSQPAPASPEGFVFARHNSDDERLTAFTH